MFYSALSLKEFGILRVSTMTLLESRLFTIHCLSVCIISVVGWTKSFHSRDSCTLVSHVHYDEGTGSARHIYCDYKGRHMVPGDKMKTSKETCVCDKKGVKCCKKTEMRHSSKHMDDWDIESFHAGLRRTENKKPKRKSNRKSKTFSSNFHDHGFLGDGVDVGLFPW